MADGARARFFEGDPRRERLQLVMPEQHVHGREKTSDLTSDRQGRSFESHGSSRHPVEPRHDPKEIEKHRFVRHLVDVLTEALDQRKYDKLILVVPAKMLGDLRKLLPARVAALVEAELDRDLTHEPEAALSEHVQRLLEA